MCLELRPLLLRHLALQIAQQLVGETALPRRAREAFLDRADQVQNLRLNRNHRPGDETSGEGLIASLIPLFLQVSPQ